MIDGVLSERALQRRLKRRLLKERQHFFAVCAPGFEQVLAEELSALGAEEVAPARGGAAFKGRIELMYQANLRLSTAHRLLLRLDEFPAQSTPMLYNRASRMAWELYLGFAPTFRLSVASRASRLNHDQKVAQTVAAAIRDRCAPLGLAPRATEDAPLEFLIRLFRDRCTISLNTSGEHLHRRGWRSDATPAPLRETLAAGCLLRSRLQAHDLVVDPFCGSGTVIGEAARLLRGIPAGSLRSFGFEHLPFHQEDKWRRLRAQAMADAAETAPARLVGVDISADAVGAARRNLARAGLVDDVELSVADALRLDFSKLRAGSRNPLLVTNLPYGHRLSGGLQAQELARELAAKLRKECRGWRTAIITRHPAFFTGGTLDEPSVLRFRNGGLPVALVQGVV